MFRALLNTRMPSILSMLAFVACCLMFCNALAGASDSAQLTPHISRELEIWGALALLSMLVFCLCLAKVTRYRRSLPDKRMSFPDSQ